MLEFLLLVVGGCVGFVGCALFRVGSNRTFPDTEDMLVEEIKKRDKTIQNQADEILRLKKLMKIKGVLQ